MNDTRLRRDAPPPFPRAPGREPRPSWPAVDSYSSRPGYGLTSERVWAAYRAAEQGAPARQCDMFEDVIENDGHLRGQYLARVKAVAERPVLTLPGGDDALSVKAAELLGDALEAANFDHLLWHLMDAQFYGYSAAAPKWEYLADKHAIVPTWFWIAPHRRFAVDDTDALRLITERNPYPGDELVQGEWMVAHPFHRKIVRGGLMRTITWWALFKRLSARDWMIFAEKFGLPLVLGYYKDAEAGDPNRIALEQAVKDIGADGAAVLSEATRIQIETIATRSGSVDSLHPAVIALCNAEISKLVTGATLSVETGGPGSFALGKVHENRSLSLTEGDNSWASRAVKRGIVTPFMAYNGLLGRAQPPRVKVVVQPEMDPLTSIQVADTAQQMGLEIDGEQMYEKYGLRRPTARTALKRPAPAPAAPAATAKK